MEHIYFALVDTPGFFAALIRRVIGQNYIHVVLSMDENMEEAYSVGRRNPKIPLLAGFEREEAESILECFPSARYMVCEMECTAEQKEEIHKVLCECMEHRYSYHYAVLGLPFIWMQIPFYQKNHFTCSSFLAKVLKEHGILISEKHFSLVTPKDFYEFPDKKVVFEGSLSELIHERRKAENRGSGYVNAKDWQEAIHGI